MITFDYNKNTSKLLLRCDNQDVFDHIREKFSVENKDAAFIRRRFKGKFKMPSRKYVITPTGICELGMYWEIRKFLIEEQVIDTVKVTDSLQHVLKCGFEYDIFTDFSINLRDYQLEVVQKAIKVGWGTCILGTGAGKTLTSAALIENYYRNCNNQNTFKCLLIVPDLGLVNQTYDEFISYGISFSVSKWTGSIDFNQEANVIICNAGVLQARFEENDWVKYVDLLLVDECHKIKQNNEISKIVTKIKTRNRYGFTGTLPQDKLDMWSVIGKLGPVLYEKTSYELREEKYLANVLVKVLNLDYGPVKVPKIHKNKYYNELEFIQTYDKRNSIISNICNKLNNNTLILVNRIRHGELLYEYLLTHNIFEKQIFFIQGNVDVEDRDKVKQLMEENSNIICIAISAIFSTGINIKNLPCIIFAAGGKAFIRTVQSIGRGLRLHEKKEKLVIFDLADMLTYSSEHAEKRKAIYDKEKIQFQENLINIVDN